MNINVDLFKCNLYHIYSKYHQEHIFIRISFMFRYLAVDRPSVKLVSFLRKHYGLVNTIPQVIIILFLKCTEKKILVKFENLR